MVAQNGPTPDETRRTRLAKTTHHLREVLVMGQWLQFLGALMLLGAFVAAQYRVLPRQSYPYLLLKLIGSAILAVVAYEEQQWDLLLLEGLWALISFWGVLMLAGRGRSLPDH